MVIAKLDPSANDAVRVRGQLIIINPTLPPDLFPYALRFAAAHLPEPSSNHLATLHALGHHLIPLIGNTENPPISRASSARDLAGTCEARDRA